MRFPLLALLISTLSVNSACSQSKQADNAVTLSTNQATTRPAQDYPEPKPVTGKPNEFPVQKTEGEWRKVLTPEQFYILRQQGTERPFSSKLNDVHTPGNFYCAADHNLLFTTATKFKSGTGWPSFFAPATANSLKVTTDNTMGMSRDELLCAKCGGHLGHVFNDGPAPTGLRYCMDGDAMVFEKK